MILLCQQLFQIFQQEYLASSKSTIILHLHIITYHMRHIYSVALICYVLPWSFKSIHDVTRLIPTLSNLNTYLRNLNPKLNEYLSAFKIFPSSSKLRQYLCQSFHSPMMTRVTNTNITDIDRAYSSSFFFFFFVSENQTTIRF